MAVLVIKQNLLKVNENMARLFRRYLNDQCTPDEIQVLLQHFNAGDNEYLLSDLIYQALPEIEEKNVEPSGFHQSLLDDTLLKIKNAIGEAPAERHKVPLIKQRWFPYLAAASVIFCLLATFFWQEGPEQRRQPKITKSVPLLVDSIHVGRNVATLTLADGKTILLDSIGEGVLVTEGNIRILKKADGKLLYDASGLSKGEVQINTISTPYGGQYQVVLADGSSVWLNAASSLRFPTAFMGKQREVEITGEAYFEVAKSKTQPFIVKAGGTKVQVLGTHFNVKAYGREDAVKTTLLEGAVKVSKDQVSALLKPGQQSRIENQTTTFAVKEVDVQKVIAWKNGLFHFDGDNINQVMDQLAYWYNVEIHFEGKKPEGHFSGIISRNMPLSKVLYILEVNEVQFQIKGRKVIVSAK